jgi:hypothetical protein
VRANTSRRTDRLALDVCSSRCGVAEAGTAEKPPREKICGHPSLVGIFSGSSVAMKRLSWPPLKDSVPTLGMIPAALGAHFGLA